MNLQKKMENSTIVSATKSSKCSICDGIGWIYELNEYPHRCTCINDYLAEKKNEKIKELFSEAYSDYTFDNFKIEDEYQKRMKQKAVEFVKAKGINYSFIRTKWKRKNSSSSFNSKGIIR